MLDALQHDATLWVLISFLIFMGLAWKLARKPLLGKLDARIAEIRRELASAAELKQEAEGLIAEYGRKQQEAEQEAQRIVEAAREQAAMIRAQAEKDADELMARKEAQLSEKMTRIGDSARQEIRDYAADLAVKATAEIITRTLDDKARARLADESIKKVASGLR